MKVSRCRVLVQLGLHVVLIGHVLAYYFLHWKSIGALDFQSFFHHLLGEGLLTAGALLTVVMFAAAFVFGRLFCSWGCHFGATQDLAAWILRKLGWRPPMVRTRFLHWTPVVLLVVIFLYPAWQRWRLGGWENAGVDFARLGPWETLPGWFLSIATFAVCGAAVLLFLGTRGFCRFVCPYGAVFRASEWVSPFKVRRTGSCGSSCSGSSAHPCTAACPTAIDVHEETDRWGAVRQLDCVRCHLCIEACPSQALAYRASTPPAAIPASVAEPARDEPASKATRAPPYSLSLGAEIAAAATAVATYVLVDLVYGGHFLAATLALAEGFLAVYAYESLRRRTTFRVLGKPLRPDGRWTLVAITCVGAFLLTLPPLFQAGAFKWFFHRGLRLEAEAGLGHAADDPPAADAAAGPPPIVLVGPPRLALEQAVVCFRRAAAFLPTHAAPRRHELVALLGLGRWHEARALAQELQRGGSTEPIVVWVLEQPAGPPPGSSSEKLEDTRHDGR